MPELFVILRVINEKDALEFDALYKEYSKQLRIIQNKMRQYYSSPADSLTDEQIEQRILDNFTNSRAILDVREQYYHRFRTILSPTQINVISQYMACRIVIPMIGLLLRMPIYLWKTTTNSAYYIYKRERRRPFAVELVVDK